MLLDLQAGDVEQGELDLDVPAPDRAQLMGAIDALNDRYGRSTVALASAGLPGKSSHKRRWVMRQDLKTPNYTTSWADLPTARAF